MQDFSDERRLWLSVVICGLSDFVLGLDPLWPYSRDFEWVCRRAGLDAADIRRKLRAGQVAPDARDRLPKPTSNVRKTPDPTRPEEVDLEVVLA